MPAQRQPNRAAEHQQQHGLRQHQPQDAVIREADGLEHRQLRNALAHRLRHGVARQQHQREKHRRHDRADNQSDIGELADQRGGERLLALGLGLVVRVRRQRVDRLRDRVRLHRDRRASPTYQPTVPLPNCAASSK